MRKGWMCVLANSQNQEQVEHVGDDSLRTTCNFKEKNLTLYKNCKGFNYNTIYYC